MGKPQDKSYKGKKYLRINDGPQFPRSVGQRPVVGAGGDRDDSNRARYHLIRIDT